MKAYQITALVLALVESACALPSPQTPRFTSKYPQHPINMGYGDNYPKYWQGQGGWNPEEAPPLPAGADKRKQVVAAPNPGVVFHPYPYSQSWSVPVNPAPAPAAAHAKRDAAADPEDQWPDHIKLKAEKMMKSASQMQDRGNARMGEDAAARPRQKAPEPAPEPEAAPEAAPEPKTGKAAKEAVGVPNKQKPKGAVPIPKGDAKAPAAPCKNPNCKSNNCGKGAAAAPKAAGAPKAAAPAAKKPASGTTVPGKTVVNYGAPLAGAPAAKKPAAAAPAAKKPAAGPATKAPVKTAPKSAPAAAPARKPAGKSAPAAAGPAKKPARKAAAPAMPFGRKAEQAPAQQAAPPKKVGGLKDSRPGPDIKQGRANKGQDNGLNQGGLKKKKKGVEKVVKRSVEVIGDYQYEYDGQCGEAVEEMEVHDGLFKRAIHTTRRVLPCGAPVTIRRVLGEGQPLPTAAPAVTIVPHLPAHAPVVAAPAPVVHKEVLMNNVAQIPDGQVQNNGMVCQIADGQIQCNRVTEVVHVPGPTQYLPAPVQTVAGPVQVVEKFLPGPAVTQVVEKIVSGPVQTVVVPGPAQVVEKIVQGPAVTQVVEVEKIYAQPVPVPGPTQTKVQTVQQTQYATQYATATSVVKQTATATSIVQEVVTEVARQTVVQTVVPPQVTRTVELPAAVETQYQTKVNTVVNTVVETVAVPGPTQVVERVPIVNTKYEAVVTPVEIESEMEIVKEVPVTKCRTYCPVCTKCEDECGCGTFGPANNAGAVQGVSGGNGYQQLGSGVGGVPRTAKDLEAFFRAKLPDEFVAAN